MDRNSRAFLYDLLQTASPTGSEQAVQRKISAHFNGIAHSIEPDVHGNLFLALNPGAKRKIMLAGHCDQIGFIVKYISPEGFIYLDSIGGTDSGVMLGEHLIIHAKSGNVEGVVGRKTLALQKGDEAQKIPAKNKIWLDIGAKSENEARERVEIGDYVTFRLEVTELPNDVIVAPGLDNKAGLFVCLEVLRQCGDLSPDVGLHVVSTVQEEIGSRGAATAASKVSPDIGIAVDVMPATDDPGYELPPQERFPCRLGFGPTISSGPNTNPVVGKILRECAGRCEVPFQPDPSGSTAANDARMLQVADSGVAVASVGIPLRNMHSQVEIVAWTDLVQSIKLLTEFVRSIRADTDLRPINFRP